MMNSNESNAAEQRPPDERLDGDGAEAANGAGPDRSASADEPEGTEELPSLEMFGGSTYHIDRQEKRPSVQTKFAVLLVPTILLVISLMVIFTRSSTMNILDRANMSRLSAYSHSVTNEVAAWTSSIISRLEAQRGAIEFLDGTPEEELAYIRSTIDPNSAYPDGIYIANQDGSYIFAKWQPGDNYDPTTRGWYIEGLRHKKFAFGDPYRDMISGRVLVSATGVLRDKDGRQRGVAGSDIQLAEISKIVSGVRLAETGGAFIVDGVTQTILGSPDTAQVGVTLEKAPSNSVYAPLRQWLEDGSYGEHTAGVGGKIVYYFLERVPDSNWVSVCFVPKAEVMGEAQTLTILAILIGLMGGLSLIAMTHMLVRRTIVKPVEELDYAVYRIAEGDLDVPINICSDDEFGRMAENLGRTTGRLYTYIDYIDEIARSLDEIGNGNLDVRPELEYEGEFTKIKDAVVSIAEKLKTAAEQEEAAKRMEMEKNAADAANKAKGRFLAQMSHEIRTPINAVLGMNEMILNEAEDDQILDYASNIDFAGHQLLSIINTILDFSKIEDGKMEIVPANYDFASVVHNLVNGAILRARMKSLAFNVYVDETIPSTLYGDDVRVTQVIQNILTNAIKYTEKGSVTFSIRNGGRDGEDVFLDVSVKDTGIGIRQEDMGKLFASFERLDTQRNRHIEGTGLGMGIVVNLLKMMGSRLCVESVYGEGSDFSFRLRQRVVDERPIGNYTERLASSARRHERGATIHAPEAKVLVVDDNAMNLKVAKNLLKMSGIVPDLAKSGPESIDMVREKAYDIVFMDHMMPGMDGVEALKKLQEENLIHPGMSVIVLTANAVAGAREEYLAAGFADYLSKPISVNELNDKLVKYLPGEKVTWRRKADGKESAEKKETDAGRQPAPAKPPEAAGAPAAPAREAPEFSSAAKEEVLEFGPAGGQEALEFGPSDALEFGPSGEDVLEFGPEAGGPAPAPSAGSVLERVAAAGLNTETGMQYCSGDQDFYLELLSDFTTEHSEKERELNSYYEKENWQDYRIRIHALKSVAKTIGSSELFEQAKALEAAAADVEVIYLKEHHAACMTLYRRLSNGIADALEG